MKSSKSTAPERNETDVTQEIYECMTEGSRNQNEITNRYRERLAIAINNAYQAGDITREELLSTVKRIPIIQSLGYSISRIKNTQQFTRERFASLRKQIMEEYLNDGENIDTEITIRNESEETRETVRIGTNHVLFLTA